MNNQNSKKSIKDGTNGNKFYYIYNFYNRKSENLGGIELIQLSDQSCKAEKSIEKHTQKCDEFTFVYGGEGSAITNGISCELKKSVIHVCFEGDSHEISNGPKSSLKYYCVGFKIPQGHPLYDSFIEMKELVKKENKPFIIDNRGIISKCKDAITEMYFDNKTPISKHLLASLINEILAISIKEFTNLNYKDYDQSIIVKRNIVYDIITYLNDNILNKDALKDISEKLNYSYSHLSHIFSQTMGETLKDYYSKIKMASAKKYLEEGYAVTEVADIFHYSTIHAFSRAYKNFFGESPSKADKY